MLAQSNARVLAILDGGGSEDYDHEGSAGAPLWSGDADGYLSSAARIVTDGDSLNRVSADTLIIDEEVLPALVGHFVTFKHGDVQETREITQVGSRPSIPAIPSVVKLYLRDK